MEVMGKEIGVTLRVKQEEQGEIEKRFECIIIDVSLLLLPL